MYLTALLAGSPCSIQSPSSLILSGYLRMQNEWDGEFDTAFMEI